MRSIRLVAPLLAAATLVWCLFVGWWIWTTPIRYAGLASDPTDPDKTVQTEGYQRFRDVSRFGALPLVIPVGLAALAAIGAWKKAHWWVLGVGTALMGYGLVTGFSIGSPYVPAGGALMLAAFIGLAYSRQR